MYIDMPATSSNQNIRINDNLSGDVGGGDRRTRRQRIERRKNATTIQRFVVRNKQNFKQTRKMMDIQVYITFTTPDSDKDYKHCHPLPAIFITGGKN